MVLVETEQQREQRALQQPVDMQKLVQVGGDITNQPGQEYLLINML